MDAHTSLSDGFPLVDRSEWEALAEAGLQGRTLASLTTTTADGIEIAPVYAGDLCAGDTDRHVRGPVGLPGIGDRTRGSRAAGQTATGWDVRALVSDRGVAAANATVLDELARGSTSVLLDVRAIGIESLDDLDAVLAGVHLEMATVALLPGPDGVTAAGWLLDLWERRSTASGDRAGLLGLDPIGVAARHGGARTTAGGSFLGNAVLALVDRSRDLPGVRAFSLDGTVYADAGASDARELGWTTAVGVAVLRALVDHGLTVDEALDQISFTWSADADQFRTICRLRAARRLWARVAEASGATDEHWGQVQHATGSTVDLTCRDPWGNLLRGTVAAFAAGVGGADAVTVRPFDSGLGRPNEFGRRTARNTQLLLLEESALASVVDPAGGSWYVEDLTRRMAEVAWDRFRDIEAVGGANAALTSGLMEAEAAACWTARRARLVTRSEIVTGVSEFPNLDESPVERPVALPASDGLLPLRRRSEPFEALRDAADAAAEVPTVRLVTVGSSADHNVRSTFATNLYAVAGIHALPGADGGSSLAVVCGSDADYARDGVAVVTGLREEGVDRVHLAAHPGALEDDLVAALRDAGVDQFVHAGLDVVDLLERTLADLGAGPVPGPPSDADGSVPA